MSAITIRGVDNSVSEKLKQAAKSNGKSINQYVLEMIKQHVGAHKEKKFTKQYDDLDDLFGIWSDKEFEAISNAVNDHRKIDPELWE
jgi:hypothetical protein